MNCPFKMANPELASHWQPHTSCYTDWLWECERENCALWNERFQMCSQAVDAYLRGKEDRRRENEITRKGG